MKLTLTLLALLTGSLLFGQPKPNYLTRAKIGSIDCSVQQNNKASNDNTSPFINLAFQNTGQQSDTKSISFDLQEDTATITNLVKDMKTAMTQLGNGSDMEWNKDAYTIKTFDVTNKIYLYQPAKTGDAHTELTKTDAQRLVTWLEGVLKNKAKYLNNKKH